MDFSLCISASNLATRDGNWNLLALINNAIDFPVMRRFGNAKGDSAYNSLFNHNEICAVAIVCQSHRNSYNQD